MTDQKRKRIIYGVFVTAVIWGLYMEPWKHPAKPGPSPELAEPATMTIAAATSAPVADNAPVIRQTDRWTVNPFRPAVSGRKPAAPAEVIEETPAPTLQGIMTVRGSRTCVLDGRVYKVGDSVGGWRIAEIGDGEVVLVGPQERRRTIRAGDRTSR